MRRSRREHPIHKDIRAENEWCRTMTYEQKKRPWDLFMWMKAVRDSELVPTTRLLLLTMVTWLDAYTGTCYPSLQTLKRGTGLSKSTVAVHLKKAEHAGFLKRTRRVKGYEYTSTFYQATFPKKDPTKTLKNNSIRAENTSLRAQKTPCLFLVDNQTAI